jgi:hypothetical protein
MTRDQLLRYYRSLTDAERIDLLVEQQKVKAHRGLIYRSTADSTADGR